MHRAGGMGAFLVNWAGGGGTISLGSSNGGAVGTRGASANNDALGDIRFDADNGTAFVLAARYVVSVDGTLSGGIPRARHAWLTADATGASVERMRLDKDGVLTNLGIPVAHRRYGTTANRPTGLGSTGAGTTYFDQTLGKPVWWSGSAWADATGAAA